MDVMFKNNPTIASMTAGQWLKSDTLHNKFVKGIANTELYTAAWNQKEWHFDETGFGNDCRYPSIWSRCNFSNQAASK